MKGYKSETQNKNLAWFLPRPKKDRYKGGMPLYAEQWLMELAREIIKKEEPKILQLFCGMNQDGYRIDLNPEVKPDLVADAHDFTSIVKSKFDIIFADPPYSTEEAKELYGTSKLNYSIWTKECDKVLNKGGLLIIYHKFVVPNPNPDKYTVVKRVFIGNRTWHLPRVCIFFRKQK
jgi:16S rRNA G966 N2-methylase RsmD